MGAANGGGHTYTVMYYAARGIRGAGFCTPPNSDVAAMEPREKAPNSNT